MRWIREHKLFSTVVGIVIVLVLVIIGSYASGGGSSVIGGGIQKAINVVEKPFASIAGGIKDGFNGIFKYKSLQEENEELKEEIEKLKQSNTNLTLSKEEYEDLQELAKVFDFEPFTGKSDAVVANIISIDNSMAYKEFTVDVGEDKGIAKGNVVVNSNGLVGIVEEVNGNTAKISSILDSNNNISFMVKRNDDILGVLKGEGKDVLPGYVMDEKANVVEGDTLITSGMGKYPKGITIGKVTDVKYDSDTQLKRVEVKPTVKFKSMQKVAIFK